MLRVGDRMTCFDPQMDLWLAARAAELADHEPDFTYQRALMTGGACEASLYMLHGRQTGALALPLGNYHNMTTEGGIGPEFVSVRDGTRVLQSADPFGSQFTSRLPATGGRSTLPSPVRSGVGCRRMLATGGSSMNGRVLATMPVLFVVLLATEAPGQSSSMGVISQTFAPDAQSLGMGEAFTAVAVGAFAPWWNPGALALVPGAVISPFSYSRIIPDFADDVILHSFSAAGTTRGVGLGASLNYLSYGETQLVSDDQQLIGTFDSYEYTLRLGAGIRPLQWFWPDLENVDWGIGTNFDRFYIDAPPAALPDPAPIGSGIASSWDLDLGTLLLARLPFADGRQRARPAHVGGRLGVVLRNVFDREIDFDTGHSDPLGRWLRFGAATELAAFDLPPLGHAVRLTLSAEGQTLYVRSDSHYARHYGAEVALLGILFVRTGYVNDDRLEIEDRSRGLGVGLDRFELANGRVVLGARFDWARVPKQDYLDERPDHYTVSAWARF